MTANADLILRFAESQGASELSPSSILRRQRAVSAFADFLDRRSLATATTEDIQAWADRRVDGRPLAVKTRSRLIGPLVDFYEWAIGEGLRTDNPAAPLHRRHPLADAGDFGDLMRRFRIAQERRGLMPSTMMSRRTTLRGLWLSLPAGASLLDVTPADILRWLDGKRMGNNARRGAIGCVGAFCRWAVREGLIEADPTVDLDRPRYRWGMPRPIADEDLDRAFAAAEPRIRAFLALAAFEGLRCQEIAGLRREDILDHNQPPIVIVRHGKGGKERAIPLHPRAWEALRAHGLPRSGPVFAGRDASQPLRPHVVSQRGNQHLHEVGSPFTMHSLRHWFASRLYAGTRDLRMVQDLLGHANPKTTAIYAAWNPGDAVGAVTALAVRR